jgi:uncharacterized protein
MELFWISLCAFAASFLTLFSGFGLGTILMPVAAIFFPVPVAIALTAFVHLLNSLLKLALLWREVHWGVTVRFGLPALFASIPGAWLLNVLAEFGSLASYQIGFLHAEVLPVKLAAGLLLIVFATAELFPFLQHLKPSVKALPVGGVLSGFFGGLSGHQGAFRSAFLINAGLDKNSFVATNAAIASLVDLSRLAVYTFSFGAFFEQVDLTLIASTSLTAFLGIFVGTMWLKKVTISFIQKLVAAMLYLLGTFLCVGVI